MFKICIIGIYFGKFPEYFPLWLNSCKYNATVDFLIITDQDIKDTPDNVKIMNMSFNNFADLVQSKFEFSISLNKPYKICDYKPAFGVICEDFIKEYDFWGHCDFDMIFGDLRKFLIGDILKTYDKILPLGHLALYRNTKENNTRFMLSGSLVGNYREVFTNDISYAFDEMKGVYQIYKANNYPVYDKRIYADISCIYKRFRLAAEDINYNNQIFCFDNGKIFREYYINGMYNKEEFIYLHIKTPKDLKIKCSPDSWGSFFITGTGFYEKKHIAEVADIEKYNRFSGILYEEYEKYKFLLVVRFKRLIDKMKK